MTPHHARRILDHAQPGAVRSGEEALESKGYKLVRVAGSHHIFEKAGVRPQIVPVHHNQVKHGYYRNAQKAP